MSTPASIELEDLGFVTIAIGGVSQRLDLFAVNNKLWDLAKAHEGKSATDYHSAVVEFLKTLGFPECSHYLADKFIRAIWSAVDDIKKKEEVSHVSPASMELTPSL